MDVKGHGALVTGGASGLGAATAKRLAAAGAKVTILDLNMDAGQALAKEIGGLAIECDVSNEASAVAALDAARTAHGNVHVLVNCAGIAPPARIVGREGPHDLAQFSKVIQVNLIGTFNMLRLAAAEMTGNEPQEDGERGVITMTASVAAFEGQIGQAAYSASKGGVVALTLPAAREFARFGVRVATIAPGLFATPLFYTLSQEAQDSLAASVPYPQRFGDPDEYARLAMHIVENRMINGETIRLDGAIRMAPK
ncbi:MAG: SDR family NAD(P)-dependent oxidoreductase [Rhodospirillaceae bacterium]|jgi:NAD(P)-dependent dehydrogenase (short-subunit alcohol dehydrogenase family)|nr:SDR family NAD(P)-dependent oxidoreductase [Rhodospirillaceae bacterium]MBT6117589.1 SDR family NAD(P)-dependent oxidoreductase [Rhodospirillaceae bacterium]